MNVFEDREKAFEAKYHLDEEIAFKVNARRDKLLGLWVAEKIGLKGSEAETYARSVVEADFADSQHAGMLKKLAQDLEKVSISEEKLRHQMDRLLAEAKQQVMTEVASGRQTVSPE